MRKKLFFLCSLLLCGMYIHITADAASARLIAVLRQASAQAGELRRVLVKYGRSRSAAGHRWRRVVGAFASPGASTPAAGAALAFSDAHDSLRDLKEAVRAGSITPENAQEVVERVAASVGSWSLERDELVARAAEEAAEWRAIAAELEGREAAAIAAVIADKVAAVAAEASLSGGLPPAAPRAGAAPRRFRRRQRASAEARRRLGEVVQEGGALPRVLGGAAAPPPPPAVAGAAPPPPPPARASRRREAEAGAAGVRRPAPGGDDRAGLLAAIRGGKQLNHVDRSKIRDNSSARSDERVGPRAAGDASGGAEASLMGQVRARIAERFQHLHGNGSDGEDDGEDGDGSDWDTD